MALCKTALGGKPASLTTRALAVACFGARVCNTLDKLRIKRGIDKAGMRNGVVV